MENREAIENLKHLEEILDEYAGLNQEGKETFALAISALEKQEQSCDTCRHKSEQFSGKRCGNCSVGYPDRYEAESNFEATSKNFEPYKAEEDNE